MSWFSFAPRSCKTGQKRVVHFYVKKKTWMLSTHVLKTHFHKTFSLRFVKFAHSRINYLTVNQYRMVALKESFSFGDIKANTVAPWPIVLCLGVNVISYMLHLMFYLWLKLRHNHTWKKKNLADEFINQFFMRF